MNQLEICRAVEVRGEKWQEPTDKPQWPKFRPTLQIQGWHFLAKFGLLSLSVLPARAFRELRTCVS